MHGLINRMIQNFTVDMYGEALWLRVAAEAELGAQGFEAMLRYEPELTERTLAALSSTVEMPRDAVLEDIGTYLVSHRRADRVRRLLRFGGVNFVEFLHSLDELPDRARLAVGDLELPQIELEEHSPDRFSVNVLGPHAGFGAVLMGVLRAMADDYGALVLLEAHAAEEGVERVDVSLIEQAFSSDRGFELSASGAGS